MENKRLALLFLYSLLPQVILQLSEDGRLDFTGLARKYGYACEEHTVASEDGYILSLFHVPGSSPRPLLLMHGFVDSADTFMMRGNKSLVGVLAEQGYDIWAGNVRGTHHGRRHVKLDPNEDKEFWDYSYHEMAYYDLPAIIDYVLTKTNAKKLNAIGHSQGNSIFYVLGSMRPEYNDKVNILIALGPISYLNNLPAPWNVITRTGDVLNAFFLSIETEELFDKQLKHMVRTVCSVQAEMCLSLLQELSGPDSEELEADFVPTLLGHYPASTSRKNMMHLVQNSVAKKFCRYDYGPETNLVKYGQRTPPDYDLKKVRLRVALYAGRNDRLAPVRNVELMRKELPNVVEYRIMKRKAYNHIDHVWGRNMDKYLFPPILKTLQMYG